MSTPQAQALRLSKTPSDCPGQARQLICTGRRSGHRSGSQPPLFRRMTVKAERDRVSYPFCL